MCVWLWRTDGCRLLAGTDPEKALLDAFKMFDEDGTGVLDEN